MSRGYCIYPSLSRERGLRWRSIITAFLSACCFSYHNNNNPTVHAYSSGAGACPAGRAAVGGYHLETTVTSETGATAARIVRSGTLSEGEFVVTLGDVTLSPVNATTNATTNRAFLLNEGYELSVFSNRYEHKGILVRLEFLGDAALDIGPALLPDDATTQIAFACFGEGDAVIGMTHINNTFKTLHRGMVQLDQAGPVALDITVVGLNNATASLYGYDRFLLQFGNATASAPTVKPTAPPTVAPVAGPTVTPTAAPTTDAPSGIPTAAPVVVVKKNTTGLASLAVKDEVVQSIALTLTVVKELSEPEVRAWERETGEWFQQFYNDTTIDRSSTRRTRSLQSIYNNYGIVLGSMETFINVTNVTYPPENVFASSNSSSTPTPMNITLIYDQILSYQAIVNDSYPGPMQYVTLPFRSRAGRRSYVEQLRNHFYAFSQLSDESLAIPLLQGPPRIATTPSTVESPTDSSTSEDDGLSVGAIVGIALAAAAVVLATALLAAWQYQSAAQQQKDAGAEAARPVGQVEFDAETFSFAPSKAYSNRRPTNAGEVQSSTAKNEYTVYAPAGRLGIVLDMAPPTTVGSSNQGPVIVMIKEGSPLMDSMVEVGDHIVALDDMDVRKMAPVKVSKLINQRSKHPIRKLTLIRSSGMCTVVQVAAPNGDTTATTTTPVR